MKTCEQCRGEFYVPAYRSDAARFCSRSCLAKAHLPQYHAEFGFKPQGNPPRKYKARKVDGRNIREHRYVMEQHLGRRLTPDEHVHHLNGDGLDNRLENLVVLSNSEHQRVEMAERKKVVTSSS